MTFPLLNASPNFPYKWDKISGIQKIHSIGFSLYNGQEVQFSHSVVSNSDSIDCSTPAFPVHCQLPEPAQTHVHHVSDAIQPSHPLSSPSPSTFKLSQYQSLSKWVSLPHQVAKVLEFQLQHQSFQWIFRTHFFRKDWMNLLAVQGTLKSLFQHHNLKASILWHSANSQPYMTTGKTIALTRRTFAGNEIPLLFNIFSRCVIAFPPRRRCLLISWLQSPSAVILESPKIKSATVSTVSPSICHEVMGPDTMILV